MTDFYHLASANPCTDLEATVQSPNPCRPPRQYLVRFFPTLVWFYTGRDELPDELFGKPLLHFSTASTLLRQPSDPDFYFRNIYSIHGLRVTDNLRSLIDSGEMAKKLAVDFIPPPVGFHVDRDCALHKHKREGPNKEDIVLFLACQFS